MYVSVNKQKFCTVLVLYMALALCARGPRPAEAKRRAAYCACARPQFARSLILLLRRRLDVQLRKSDCLGCAVLFCGLHKFDNNYNHPNNKIIIVPGI